MWTSPFARLSLQVNVQLIDSEDIVNPEGFYNYLTAWFHQDNMMYYVSQAAFFPTPPGWQFVQSVPIWWTHIYRFLLLIFG
jgi:hypothetical protein